mmetsp:Transcript_11508/g.34420  ORF Transcript_11508/g.34420 Transcript_11508/m.34420 type:complete len:258 (-) Transcript_11508:14-787(-)
MTELLAGSKCGDQRPVAPSASLQETFELLATRRKKTPRRRLLDFLQSSSRSSSGRSLDGGQADPARKKEDAPVAVDGGGGEAVEDDDEGADEEVAAETPAAGEEAAGDGADDAADALDGGEEAEESTPLVGAGDAGDGGREGGVEDAEGDNDEGVGRINEREVRRGDGDDATEAEREATRHEESRDAVAPLRKRNKSLRHEALGHGVQHADERHELAGVGGREVREPPFQRRPPDHLEQVEREAGQATNRQQQATRR